MQNKCRAGFWIHTEKGERGLITDGAPAGMQRIISCDYFF